MQLRLKWLPILGSAAVPTCLVILLYVNWPSSELEEEDVKQGLPTTQRLNISDLNFPDPRVTLHLGPHFNFFEKSSFFPFSEHLPRRDFSPMENSWHLRVQEKAAEHLSRSMGLTIRVEDFLHGRYRFLPSGLECDLYFRSPERSSGDLRVTLFQPLGLLHVVRLTNVESRQLIHLLIHVNGATNRLRDFLDHLADHVLPFDPYLTLTLVTPDTQQVSEVILMAQEVFKVIPDFKWVVEAQQKSRATGTDEESSKEFGDLLMVAEEEVFFHPDFLARCRGNVARGRQVYFPIPFALYNPTLTYPLFDQEVPHLIEQLEVKEHFGYWKTSKVVAACTARADLTNLLKEDGQRGFLFDMFTEAMMAREMKIIRSPDPSLFIVYEDVNCNATRSGSYPECVKEKAQNLGPQELLGLSLLKVKEGTDFEGILSKRFHYFSLVPLLLFSLVVLMSCNFMQMSLIYRQARALRNLKTEAAMRGKKVPEEGRFLKKVPEEGS